ncbi:MAG: TRAP transporter substrate-binding protein [Gammaproteobacteria bacterium]|nr:TRAP transporter substrate-binding protein [Gammaproteobacteria bacterium]
MRISRILPWLLIACLGACGGPAGESEPAGVAVGGTEVAGSPGSESWQAFETYIAESEQDIALRMLIRGQLGSEEQLLSGLRRGRIQIASMSALAVSTLVPEITMLYAPFLFADEAEADFVFDNYLAEPLAQLLAEQGLHLVEWHEIGFHHVYAREPRLLPEDYRNVRFRVSASIAAQQLAQALGADLISMGFADVVPSLQTGLIDAGENAIPYYARTGISEQAPHLMLTSHALGMNVILANASWWASLPDDRRALFSAAFPSRQEIRARVRTANAEELAQAQSIGFTAHTLDPGVLGRWRVATEGAHENLIRASGGSSREIYQRALDGRAQWRTSAGPDVKTGQDKQ